MQLVFINQFNEVVDVRRGGFRIREEYVLQFVKVGVFKLQATTNVQRFKLREGREKLERFNGNIGVLDADILELLKEKIDIDYAPEKAPHDYIINYVGYYPYEALAFQNDLIDSGLFKNAQCYTTIALFGTEYTGHSDTIIIAAIDNDTKNMKLCCMEA